MTIYPKGKIARAIFDALGGENSPIREFTRARLGHPALSDSEIYVPADIRQYDGQVWLHDPVGDYPIPDSADTERDDSPPSVFTGFMAAEKVSSGRRRFGTQVRIVWRNGRYEVEGTDGPAAETYLRGTPELKDIIVGREQLDWSLLRPTDPPSARVVLAGGQFRHGDTWYSVPDIISVDLIATYAASLTAGEAVAVQIELDPTDSTITYTASSAFTDTSRDTGTGAVDHSRVFANYPVGASNDVRHYGWVKLYAGIQAIHAEDILVAPDDSGGAGSGESNTASNVGTAGVGVFKQKTGVDLEFKTINAGSSKVSVTDDTGDNEVDIDVVEANLTLGNLGGTLSILKGGTGQTTRGPAFSALAPQTPGKGDLIVYNGSNHVNFPAAADGLVLSYNSATATGLEAVAQSGGGGSATLKGAKLYWTGVDHEITTGNSYTISYTETVWDSDSYVLSPTNLIFWEYGYYEVRLWASFHMDASLASPGTVILNINTTYNESSTVQEFARYIVYPGIDNTYSFTITAETRANMTQNQQLTTSIDNDTGESIWLEDAVLTFIKKGDTIA